MPKIDVSPAVEATPVVTAAPSVAVDRTYGLTCVFNGAKDLTLSFRTETKRDSVAKAIQNTRGNFVAVRAEAIEGHFLICTPLYVRILD